MNISTEDLPLVDVNGEPPNPILQVDFSWKKFKALVSEHGKPKDPIYVIDYQSFRSPNLIFKSTADDKIIGSGTLHAVSINAKYEVNGEKGTLKALRRFKTEYTHLSRAFSDGGGPIPMRWTTTWDFKTWNFICLDEQEIPVAKFSANAWATHRIGNLEFMGPKATSQAARDEIMVVALTLLYCMMLRVNSLLSLIGACFARPGPLPKEPAAPPRQKATKGD
ncbi:hypothetical protein B0J13DRAFT_443460 [Dactylonectria estremocensis]|uniref:Uncharacterized protein n=1 Tax=Dactylonectria estremocensis TaxID=1079267 RepID=A0A9P9J7T6_9HYPO|nr:hypothetical protein B0J13DRAFT_443460 [Dactylonectria estremocensis]